MEVRVDDGAWEKATISKADEPFCWALWKHEVALKPGKHTLTVRAADNTNVAQPEKTPWNAKGYQYHGWHSVAVEVA